MIQKFNDYDSTQAYSGGSTLPNGAYICKIIGAKVEDYTGSQAIKVAFDIAEGEQKGHFQSQYDSNDNEDKRWPISGTYTLWVPKDDGSQLDGYTKRKFKTFTNALEDSNSGYHFDWDESKFKGKLIGFTLCSTFYANKDGSKCGFSPAVYDALPVSKVKSKSYRAIPEQYIPKKLNSKYEEYLKKQQSDSGESINDFVPVSGGNAEEIPF